MKIKVITERTKKILRLSISLAKTNFKIRNEGSYIGIIWYLIDPLAMFLIIIMLGNILGNNNIEYYPLYLFMGLIMFNFFRQSTITATNCISVNSGFIKSMKIDLEAFVISGVFQSVFSHVFEIAAFLVFFIYFKVSPFGLLFYPMIFLVFLLFVLGTSFLLATIGTYVYDLSNVWGVIMNIMWFATPIFYIVPKSSLNLINWINPLYYFISVSRDVVIYNMAPITFDLIVMLSLTILLLFIGIFLFERSKKRFAERV